MKAYVAHVDFNGKHQISAFEAPTPYTAWGKAMEFYNKQHEIHQRLAKGKPCLVTKPKNSAQEAVLDLLKQVEVSTYRYGDQKDLIGRLVKQSALGAEKVLHTCVENP